MSEEKEFERFDEIVRKESKKPSGEIFCPECGSSRLYYLLGFRLGQIYVCKRCGYQGAFVVEDGEMAAKMREEWIKNKEGEGSQSP